MATETQDTRALLAKMEAERIAAHEKARKAEEDYEVKSKELLAKLREADFADVFAKVKMHGFSATDLRGALKVKGAGRKTVAKKSPARKTATRGRKPKAA